MAVFGSGPFKAINTSVLGPNEDGLEPGEAWVIYYNMRDGRAVTGDVVVGGHGHPSRGRVVAEDVEFSGDGRVVVPAPNLTGDHQVWVAGQRARNESLSVKPGDQERPNTPLSEMGYGAGSNVSVFTDSDVMHDYNPANDPHSGDWSGQTNESGTFVASQDAPQTTSAERPENDPADQPGLVHADNQQGFRLAPSFRDDYDDAAGLIEDAQDGTLDKLTRSSGTSGGDTSSGGGSTPTTTTDSSGNDSGLAVADITLAGAAVVVLAAAYYIQHE